jgi:cell division GTPase FtsZ
MTNLFIGVGQAGCNIVNEVFEKDDLANTDLANALAINSTVEDMRQLDNIDREQWYVIANDGEMLRGDEPGLEGRAKRGFGSRPENSDQLAEGAHDEIEEMLDQYLTDLDLEERFNHVLVCLGLGGGTGCGYAPHVAEVVANYDDDLTEVLGVGVLPDTTVRLTDGGETVTDQSDGFFVDSVDEPSDDSEDDDGFVAEEDAMDGPDGAGEGSAQRSWNTIYGLKRMEDVADGIILVDNQRRVVTESAQDFTDYNRYIGEALGDLLSPTALSVDVSEEDVATLTLELSDIVNSVTNPEGSGETGYATIGWSGEPTRSLLGYLVPFYNGKVVDEQKLALDAIERRSLAGVDPADAAKALGHLRTPQSHLGDGGVQAETFESFLRTLCREAVVGQTLTDRSIVSFAVILTYRRHQLGRLDQIYERAQEHKPITWS